MCVCMLTYVRVRVCMCVNGMIIGSEQEASILFDARLHK